MASPKRTGTSKVKPAVSTASAIKINAVIRPSHTATGIADWIGQKHFDTLVNRTTFVPPEEMRQAAHELSETKQRLISEKSYTTELEKRAQARPSASPSASFKP